MQNSDSIELGRAKAGIYALSVLYPPDKVTIIGNETSIRSGFIVNVKSADVRLIDSKPFSQSSARPLSDDAPGFTRHNLLVSATGGVRPYYKASLDRESGLIEPESLSALWQNISTTEEFEVETVSLEAALLRTAGDTGWLVFEHFGAFELLENIDPIPGDIDVIVARAVGSSTKHDIGKQFTEASLESELKRKGFFSYSQIPTRHPLIRYFVFVRDWKNSYKSEIGSLKQNLQKLKQTLSDSERSQQESIANLKRELGAAEKDRSLAVEQRSLAENNLSNLEEEYKKLAKTQLRHEQQLQDVEHHLSIAINQLEAEHRASPITVAETEPDDVPTKRKSTTNKDS
ncbi:MAG: hypothetical protein K0U61_06425 [Alphaproteobacteria bacterium]|nr:hypothetical protein [Alphaproteobacteria bacterium]